MKSANSSDYRPKIRKFAHSYNVHPVVVGDRQGYSKYVFGRTSSGVRLRAYVFGRLREWLNCGMEMVIE